MRLSFFAISVSFCVAASAVAIAADQCPGVKNKYDHSDGYVFFTTSQVYFDANVWIYETCVENPSKRDLDFNWYIPGPNSWVPAGKAVPSPRRRVTHETMDGAAGCLRYGNEWIPGSADFLPHGNDKAALDDEKKLGCAEVVRREGLTKIAANLGDAPGKIFAINESLEVYAPVNLKEPHNSMVHVTANVQVEPLADGSAFRHIFSYSVSPLDPERFEGSFKGLHIIPDDSNIRALYQAQDEAPDGIITLDTKGGVEIKVPSPKNPTLGDVHFSLFTGNNERVAVFYVPFWLEQ
jgi:hypothetical protein